tara:strand:+ start:750 stop:1118 length:369 start_codon:yes stop_codon:yes gene_type:complete
MQITGDKLDKLSLEIDNYRMTDDLIDYMWEDERDHYSEEIETNDDWSKPHIFKTMFVVRFQNELNDILKNLDDEDDHILLNADTCEHLAVSGNYDFDDVEELNVVISETLGNYVALKIGDLI